MSRASLGACCAAESILLVEDDMSVRTLAVSLLRRLGYSVQPTANGNEALEMAQSPGKNFDLLMTDVVMPEMDGKELADRLGKIAPDIAILFTSGYTENVIVHHGILAERLHFLSKPYSIQTLANKLAEVLAARRRDIEAKR